MNDARMATMAEDTQAARNVRGEKRERNVFFATNRHLNTACLLPGFDYWEQVQGAAICGIQMPDGAVANGIGRCYSVAEFKKRAAHGGTTILEEHVCTYGPVQESRFTGNPHRRCTECGAITLDLSDDEGGAL